MLRRPLVSAFHVAALPETYDALICALGYEKRARFFVERYSPHAQTRVAVSFPWQHELSFNENASYFNDRSFQTIELDDEAFSNWSLGFLNEPLLKGPALHLCIDITSFSRLRLAMLVDAIRQSRLPGDITVDFVYALAKYSGAPAMPPANEWAAPVLPSFAGWSLEPDRGPTAVIGLGYENDKAVGAVEVLQASRIWTFEPRSSEIQYALEVERANRPLLAYVTEESRMTYRVENPYNLFVALESLIYGSLQNYNPIILPFGPKVFALASLLVACLYDGVGVWRVSGGQKETPIQRAANGHVGGLSVTFLAPTAI